MEEMQRYCELIAALKIRSTNCKGKHLSTPRAIWILENHGIDLEGKELYLQRVCSLSLLSIDI